MWSESDGAIMKPTQCQDTIKNLPEDPTEELARRLFESLSSYRLSDARTREFAEEAMTNPDFMVDLLDSENFKVISRVIAFDLSASESAEIVRAAIESVDPGRYKVAELDNRSFPDCLSDFTMHKQELCDIGPECDPAEGFPDPVRDFSSYKGKGI